MIFTVGRSTLALDAFVARLQEAGGRGVADVRRHPGSRRLPWFAAEALRESLPFAAGLERLEAIAHARPTAVMCAEAPWWRCHRRLVADALVVRGHRVRHLLPDARAAAAPPLDY